MTSGHQPGGSRRWPHRSLHVLVQGAAISAVAIVTASCTSASTATTATSTATASKKAHLQHRREVAGIVRAVSANDLTLRIKSSSRALVLSSKTRYRQDGHSTGEHALVDGEHVRVRLANGVTAPTAASVVILPPSFTGTVHALAPGGFTLTGRNGALLTFSTASSTRYRSGKQATSASALHPGERVRVIGNQLSNGTTRVVTVIIVKSG